MIDPEGASRSAAEPPTSHRLDGDDAGARDLCAEWRERLRGATPAPWTGSPWEMTNGVAEEYVVAGPDGVEMHVYRSDDAELIVWMRNHAEAIIAALSDRAPAREAAERDSASHAPSGVTLAADPITGPTCPTCCSHDHSRDAELKAEFEAVGRMLREDDHEGLAAYVNRRSRQRAKAAVARINDSSEGAGAIAAARTCRLTYETYCSAHHLSATWCDLGVEAALAAARQEAETLRQQVATWKMHAYDHGYQP